MIALTGAERTRKLRLRKKASALSKDYLGGETLANPMAFIDAKEAEACEKHGFAEVKMNMGLVNDFLTLLDDWSMLKLGSEPVDNEYIQVIDLVQAWSEAKKMQG